MDDFGIYNLLPTPNEVIESAARVTPTGTNLKSRQHPAMPDRGELDVSRTW